jgi:hypothetical protein
MHIAVVADLETVNAQYRAVLPMEELRRRGHVIEFATPRQVLQSFRHRRKPDVVLIHRYVGPDARVLTAQARAASVGVVWDNDDDIGAIPRGSAHHARFGSVALRDVERGVDTMAKDAHVVTTPSGYLAEKYRAMGARNVHVLENYLPRHFCQVARSSHSGIVVVWVAGLEHQIDHQRLRLQRTLERLLDVHADVQLLSIGLGLGIDSVRYRRMRGVDHENLARGLGTCDIGIAPLVDIPWNRARSNVKVKEYAAAGLAWLASPVTPYESLGEREGGRLVADGEWFSELSRLVVDARGRRKLARRASKWAARQTIEQHAVLWLSAFSEAMAAARPAPLMPS